MEKRLLGGLRVSPIGVGCMGFSHGYGDIPSEDYSVDAIRAAYDFGCTFFDTAESYSPNLAGIGHNELIVGKAVRDFRDDVVLATKLRLDPEEVEREGAYGAALRHLKGSMERLGTDHVDLYYLNRVNRAVPVEEVAVAMGRLVEEGLIGGWGLSQVDVGTIRRAHEVAPVSAVQNIYSMVERGVEGDVIPYCMENGIGVVPFSPIASGLLSGKVTPSTDFSHPDDVRKFVPQLKPENIGGNQPLLDVIRRFAEAKGATMAQMSLAWMLCKYPNVVPIPGSKNRGRILENLGAWNVRLSDSEFAALEGALDSVEVHGERGYMQFDGDSMSSWGSEKR